MVRYAPSARQAASLETAGLQSLGKDFPYSRNRGQDAVTHPGANYWNHRKSENKQTSYYRIIHVRIRAGSSSGDGRGERARGAGSSVGGESSPGERAPRHGEGPRRASQVPYFCFVRDTPIYPLSPCVSPAFITLLSVALQPLSLTVTTGAIHERIGRRTGLAGTPSVNHMPKYAPEYCQGVSDARHAV